MNVREKYLNFIFNKEQLRELSLSADLAFVAGFLLGGKEVTEPAKLYVASEHLDWPIDTDECVRRTATSMRKSLLCKFK